MYDLIFLNVIEKCLALLDACAVKVPLSNCCYMCIIIIIIKNEKIRVTLCEQRCRGTLHSLPLNIHANEVLVDRGMYSLSVCLTTD